MGHAEILRAAMNHINPDRVIVIPNYQSPLKDRILTDASHRLEMLKLAFKNWNQVEISSYELDQKKKCYTIETVLHFQHLYPDAKLYLLLGSDQLMNIKQWKRYDELLNLVTIVCYKRKHFCQCCKNYSCVCDTPVSGIKDLIYLNQNLLDISSSQVRKEVHPYELNESVLNYINDHGLYGIQRIKGFEKDSRFAHSLRVAQMSKDLMAHYKPEETDLAYCAGLYHDIAKDLDLDWQEMIAQTILGITDYVSPRVLHGYVGAYILKANFLFSNEYVLNAIRRHTRPFDYYDTEPTLLDKVVYLADKLEPNRTNEDVCGDVNYFRQLAYQDIHQCFTELYEHTQLAFKNKNNN